MTTQIERKHIIALGKFTDLTHSLKYKDFIHAGHRPVRIEFAEKNKAIEARDAIRHSLGTSHGYSLVHGKQREPYITDRLQKINTMVIHPLNIKNEKGFDSFFDHLSQIAPFHFNEKNPAPIKRLETVNIKTGQRCIWIKAEIRVSEGVDELRLQLNQVDGVNPLDFGVAENAAGDMIETVCETTEIAIHRKVVCSMIAEDYEKKQTRKQTKYAVVKKSAKT